MTQRRHAGEAQILDPSVSSQALYHWATALPIFWTYMNGITIKINNLNVMCKVSSYKANM